MDKVAHEISCPFKFKHHLNLNGQLINLYPLKWCTREGRGKASAWEKIHEKLFRMNSNGRRRSEVAQGVEVEVVSNFKST